MTREVYVGFSTAGVNEPPYRLTDIELVKQDILNSLKTRRGERVMRPNFGTRIYDILMDPFDDETREAILEDVIAMISLDPRVSIVSVDAQELEHTMRVSVELRFVPQDVVDLLYIEYTRRNLELG